MKKAAKQMNVQRRNGKGICSFLLAARLRQAVFSFPAFVEHLLAHTRFEDMQALLLTALIGLALSVGSVGVGGGW